jgi:hypothetical protein
MANKSVLQNNVPRMHLKFQYDMKKNCNIRGNNRRAEVTYIRKTGFELYSNR